MNKNIIDFTETKPNYFEIDYKEFLAKRDNYLDKMKNFAKLSVLVPAGLIGLDKGYSFPDTDISILGIGAHRYFLFHSAIGLYVLEKFYFKWLENIKDNESTSNKVVKKVSGVILGTFAVGIGIHLAVDIFQPKSIVFPFFGSLADGTLIDDRLWLLGNSLWCFKIAKDIYVISVGNELEKVKCYIQEKFINPMKEGIINMNERMKGTIKDGLTGAVVGSIIEELVEFIVPGIEELGALGEIAGAIFGVAHANKDKIMEFLEELKKVTNSSSIRDLLNSDGYRRWKEKYPEYAAQIDRGLTMS